MNLLFIIAAAFSVSVQAIASPANPHGYVLTITNGPANGVNGNATGVLSDGHKKLGSVLCTIGGGAEDSQEVFCGKMGPSDPQALLQSDAEFFTPDDKLIWSGGLTLSGKLIQDGPVQLNCQSAGPETATDLIVFPITCK